MRANLQAHLLTSLRHFSMFKSGPVKFVKFRNQLKTVRESLLGMAFGRISNF